MTAGGSPIFFDVLADDERYPDRWFLDEPWGADGLEIDEREFTYGRGYKGPTPVRVQIRVDGQRVAFLLGGFDMPVVRTEVAETIERIAPGQVQGFPVTVGEEVEGYEILNAIRRVDCIDPACVSLWWTKEDNRPNKLGMPRDVSQLRILPRRVGDSGIFRVHGWHVALIVSERLRWELSKIEDLGVRFEPVT